MDTRYDRNDDQIAAWNGPAAEQWIAHHTVGLADGGYGDASFKENLSYLNEVSAFTVLPNMGSIIWAGVVNLNPAVAVYKT